MNANLTREIDSAKLPTDQGAMTPEQILHSLQYSSYCANRGYGMTMEQLKGIGFSCAEQYERLYQQEALIIQS